MGMQNLQGDEDDIISTINVTPLVDIMLVLLIIFMLVSSFVDFSAIEVDLPHAATGEEIKKETVSIVISKQGEYWLSGEKMDSFSALAETLGRKKAANTDIQVILSADRKVYHEQVVRVIDTLRKMDILKFAINIEPVDDEPEK